MRFRNGVRNFPHQYEGFTPRNWTVRDSLLQRATIEQRHNEERVTAGGGSGLEDRRDMVEQLKTRHSVTFTLETASHRRVAAPSEHFDSYDIVGVGAPSAIDVCIATRAYEREIFVA